MSSVAGSKFCVDICLEKQRKSNTRMSELHNEIRGNRKRVTEHEQKWVVGVAGLAGLVLSPQAAEFKEQQSGQRNEHSKCDEQQEIQ